MIRDSHKRQMTFELDVTCRSLEQKMPDSEEYTILARTYGNLVRMWGDV